METNQLSTELAKLPEVLTANASLADRAVLKVRSEIEPLKNIDLTTVDALVMEQNDQKLNDLQVKLKESYTIMNDRRKPYTQRMDEIKSMFTAEEKKIIDIGSEVKAIRDNWNKEKARRTQILEDEKKRKAEKAQALIDCKASIVKHFNDVSADTIVKLIYRMYDKFHSFDIPGLKAYEPQLKNWKPDLDIETWNAWCGSFKIDTVSPLLTSEEFNQVFIEVGESEGPKLKSLYTNRLIEERDKLLETFPSRIRELEKISTDADAAKISEQRLQKEREDMAAKLEQEKMDREQAIQTEAEAESLNTSFEIASEATPVVGMSKGTVVKKKYQAKNHKAHVAIVQWWVQNCMSKMTLDELQKKLSFMRTAADKALNEGTTIEADGLEVVEDYSTRATREKEVAA
jgi:hypothetical protein